MKGLGATLTSSLRPSVKDADSRALKAHATNGRAKRSLAPWTFRKRVLTCKMCPQLCYSAPFAKPSVASLRKLRSSAIGAIWGRGRSKRAPEMVMIILSDPIRADPEMAVAAETLLAFMRLIQRNPLELFRIWIIRARTLKAPIAAAGGPTFLSAVSLMRLIQLGLR